MRYRSKDELLNDIATEHDRLWALLEAVPRSRHDEAGVWGDGWTISDLIAHLAAWHRLLLGWHAQGLAGETPALPAPGYKWSETPRLNRDLWAKDRGRPFEAVRDDFASSHADVVRLIDGLAEAELFEPGHFAWTRKNPLVTYVGANTASHYRFAQKVLKRWLKGEVRTPAGGS